MTDPLIGSSSPRVDLTPPLPSADTPTTEATARDFESTFTGLLVKELRKALPGDGLFGKGPGAQIFEGLFDQMMGEALAEGEGLGIRNLLLEASKTSTPQEVAKPSDHESIEGFKEGQRS